MKNKLVFLSAFLHCVLASGFALANSNPQDLAVRATRSFDAAKAPWRRYYLDNAGDNVTPEAFLDASVGYDDGYFRSKRAYRLNASRTTKAGEWIQPADKTSPIPRRIVENRVTYIYEATKPYKADLPWYALLLLGLTIIGTPVAIGMAIDGRKSNFPDTVEKTRTYREEYSVTN
jgi:hypothetical protein